MDDGIPAFLKIPQDERKAAWDAARLARPLPPQDKPKYLPINDAPPEPKT